ncbi:MAG: protease modulator HflC [Rhodospirillaceae bacterium]|nr:protease modulator HflC [Rhodospirillaceae bacterium]
MSRRYAFLGLGAVVFLFVMLDSLFVVHQTKQALVLQFGDPRAVYREPGLYFKLPFFQNVVLYEKRVLDLDPEPEEMNLRDQRRIIVDLYARYKIVDPLQFRKAAGNERVVRQRLGRELNNAVRVEVAKVLLPDMLSEKRAEVMDHISAAVKEREGEFGIEVIDVRVGRTELPKDTADSLYNRMRSDRFAEAARYRADGAEMKAKIQAEAERERTVILAEARRKSQILRGEGDATRNEILGKAYGKDPEFFAFYRSMEAYREALGADTTMVLSPESEFFRYFDAARGRK